MPNRLIYHLITLVITAVLVLFPSVSQAKAVDDQDQIILLNDSAAALEDTDPELSKNLTKFADEKEKEWENKSANKNEPPSPMTDKYRAQVQGKIKILKAAALAMQPTYPLIAKSLETMAQNLNRIIEIEE